MLLIDSMYINNGGGKILLDYLVEELIQRSEDVFFLFDKRTEDSYRYVPANQKYFIESKYQYRIKYYLANQNRFHKVICLGNIPPPIKLVNTIVITYFQNILILKLPKEYAILKLVYTLGQKYLIKILKSHSDLWFVQSNHVKEVLSTELAIPIDSIKTLPFFRSQRKYFNLLNKNISFFYPSSASLHKNHLRLLAAWELLFCEGENIELILTIPKKSVLLLMKIKQLNMKGMKIINHGNLPFTQISKLYASSKYVIFPSLSESFGLPLVEAVQHNCILLASDLPYTHSVVQPSETFDPHNISDIKRAVLYVLNNNVPQSLSKVENEIEKLINEIK